MQFFDYEDMILLLKTLNKSNDIKVNNDFCKDIYGNIVKRVTSQEFISLMRSQIDYDKFLQLIQLLNQIYMTRILS